MLKAIVIRPAENERERLNECELSLAGGVHGDAWARGCWMSLPDGRPHPDVQIALTNSRLMDIVARDESRWALSGDNLYVDFDLAESSLQPGDRLAIGSALLEITEVAHTGCRKYAQRFGQEALKFISADERQNQRLRGIYARVVQDGVVCVGDSITRS